MPPSAYSVAMNSSGPITISVKPLRTGWTLECAQLLEIQVFRSGGDAERSAIRLAAALTKVGWRAKVVVHDLGGLIAGSLEVGPESRHRPQWLRTLH